MRPVSTLLRTLSSPGAPRLFKFLPALMFVIACGDSSTTSQPTSLDPGDRFEEAYPESVTDLSVRTLDHHTVELSWTDVDDGKGSPSRYEVRFAGGVGEWEQGTTPHEGACGYPVAGSSVGSTIRCVLTGLEPAKSYRFMVAAERLDPTGVVRASPSPAVSGRTRDEPLLNVPTRADIVSGENQFGTVGQALPRDVRIQLRDSAGLPMSNVYVVWATHAGGGSTASPVSLTDASGIARTVWVLGPQAGPQSLGAQVQGMEEVILSAEAVPGPVDEVRFALDTVRLSVGAEESMVVEGWDEYGNAIEGLELEWQTSNQIVAGVDARGLVTVNGRGWAWIRAWIRDRLRKRTVQDSTTVVVEATPTAVSDLGVVDAGEDWLGLAFTQTDDGTGSPASYEMRWGPTGTDWSHASPIADGACRSPVSGTSVGSRHACTLAGLAPGTGYVVHARAFREKNGQRTWSDGTASTTGTTLAAPAVPSGIAPESGVNQVGTVGAPLPNPVVLKVLDAAGTAVAGAQVWFAASDGGTLSAASTTTDGQGRASVVWTLGSRAGTQSLTVTLEPVGGAGSGGPAAPAAVLAPLSIPATAGAGPVDSVAVSPAALTLDMGETRSLSVQAFDQFGNATAPGSLVWSSDDAGVATVDATGGVAAQGGGQTRIRARSGSVEGAASVAVQSQSQPPTTGDPDQITSLRVVSATSTSIEIEFKEVDDGTGTPASAELRYAYSPIGWGWGSATVQEVGPCASGTTGSAIGAARRCVIDGLEPGTAYDFQMVAWRTESGQRVYSTLSNVATGSTDAGSTPSLPAVVSVSVTPGQSTLDVGSTQQLYALAYDASNNVVASPITWTSSDPTVATVSSSGVVTARSAGTVLITAAALCCGEADSAQLTVMSTQQPPPPPPATGDAWFVQGWSFADIAALRSGVTAIETGGRLELLTDLVGAPGFTTAVRAQHLAAISHKDSGVGVSFAFPKASVDRPREIWAEWYMRFSPNFTTQGPFSGGSDFKTVFLFDQEHTGSWRWALHLGVFGTAIQIRGPVTGEFSLPADLFNGQWKRFRLHAKMDPNNGFYDWNIDGVDYRSARGDTDRGSQYYFNDMSIGRTFNKGVAEDMYYDFGPVSVYVGNPGW